MLKIAYLRDAIKGSRLSGYKSVIKSISANHPYERKNKEKDQEEEEEGVELGK